MAGAMIRVELSCPPERRERLIAELWERGVTGIVEEGERLCAYFEDDADRLGLAETLADYAPRICVEAPDDWTAIFRAAWRPMLVGRRFFLAPEWCPEPTPPGRIRLLIRPRRACGTGLHPATRLCLELMETLVRPGARVLDVGTGSGLLAEAAVRLGAGWVVALDIEREAVAEARQRFSEAGLPGEFLQGSLRSLAARVADLALANISAEAVIQLAGELARVLAPGAAALVSGFRPRQLERVRAALEGAGLRAGELQESEGWLALVCYTPSYAQT